MQSVTKPRDAEWELAQDIGELTSLTAYANMPQRILPPCLAVAQVGIVPMTPTVWKHSFSIDVWAGSGSDYADAWDAANDVAGALGLLNVQRASSDNDWHEITVANLYPNPDTNRPDIPRVTLTCSAGLTGTPII